MSANEGGVGGQDWRGPAEWARDLAADVRNWVAGHRWLAVAVAAAVAVALVAAVLVASGVLTSRPGYANFGNPPFNANLSGVEAKISAENRWVDGTGQPYITIAVVATMSPDPNIEPVDPVRTRHALEGAYLAQYANNHPDGPASRPDIPLVKLLLADEGSQEASWRQVAAALQADATADHLVAVTGLGISETQTTDLIRQLNRGPHDLALVASVLTGDEFSNIQNLELIAPPNSAQAAAAARALSAIPQLPRHVRIWMTVDKTTSDGYARSLATQFPAALRATRAPAGRAFSIAGNPTTFHEHPPSTDTALSLNNIGDAVCSSHANVVYFAGRGADLQSYLKGLGQRPCAAGHPLTVLTGSDASALIGQQDLWPAGASLRLYYTALATPASLTAGSPYFASDAPQWFGGGRHPYRYGFQATFPHESLWDSWAIMFHDGVQAVIEAADQLTSNNKAVTGANVAQVMPDETVPGASGFICFNSVNEPSNKAIPIVTLDGNGRPALFELSSASGQAPATAASCGS